MLKRKLIAFVGGRVDIQFVRAAVTPEQIEAWRLPSRPTKRDGNRHAQDFVGDSVELDAIPTDRLRALARGLIEQHIDPRKLAVTLAAERSERAYLRRLADAFEGRAS